MLWSLVYVSAEDTTVIVRRVGCSRRTSLCSQCQVREDACLKLPSCCVVTLLLNVSLTLVAILLSFGIALARKTSGVIRFYGKGSVRKYAAKAKTTPY